MTLCERRGVRRTVLCSAARRQVAATVVCSPASELASRLTGERLLCHQLYMSERPNDERSEPIARMRRAACSRSAAATTCSLGNRNHLRTCERTKSQVGLSVSRRASEMQHATSNKFACCVFYGVRASLRKLVVFAYSGCLSHLLLLLPLTLR